LGWRGGENARRWRGGLYNTEPVTISVQPLDSFDCFIYRLYVLDGYSYFVFAFGYYAKDSSTSFVCLNTYEQRFFAENSAF
jgi:hypothetical protein